MQSEKPRKRRSWQNALLATSGLGALFVATSVLWQSGYPQWGFILAFAGVWALIAISWSNVDFTEETGAILARIVDHNFDQMHERVSRLEAELDELHQRMNPATER